VVEALGRAAEATCAEAGLPLAQVAGVGVGAPGPVDFAAGVIVDPPNLPGFERVPLGALLGERLGLPVRLDNDANAAGLGEARFGAGQGASPLVYLTVSTGIGGAILIGGELLRGAAGAAGELGHLVIQPHGPRCGCGGEGCLEAVASGTAIAREARLGLVRGEPSLLSKGLGNDLPGLSAKEVAEAAAQGDAFSLAVLDHAFTLLGLGVAGLVNALNPARVVVGGGLAALGDRLLDPIRAGILRHSNKVAAQSVTVVQAALGRNAGVVGAAALAMPWTPFTPGALPQGIQEPG
jgi:glucokinase